MVTWRIREGGGRKDPTQRRQQGGDGRRHLSSASRILALHNKPPSTSVANFTCELFEVIYACLATVTSSLFDLNHLNFFLPEM